MPARLHISRRYVDMNGRYVGELYLDGVQVGMSLDNLPLDYKGGYGWRLDVRNDFLKPLGARTVRVGGIDPENDPYARQIMKGFRFRLARLTVVNNFVEHVLGV